MKIKKLWNNFMFIVWIFVSLTILWVVWKSPLLTTIIGKICGVFLAETLFYYSFKNKPIKQWIKKGD